MHTVMSDKELKKHALELNQKANEELIRFGLTRLELFHICKDVGLLNVQAKIAFKEGRKKQTSQIIQFITDYINNDGMIAKKYESTGNYIAPEWQPIVALLDKIDNKARKGKRPSR